MKKLFTLVIAVAAVLPSWASRPLLVGHRGSDIGVENTVQSFTEGAKPDATIRGSSKNK